MIHVLGDVMGWNAQKIWHKESDLKSYGNLDLIVLPGGFSYGDYLRSGAIASHSPIMAEVVDYANKGGRVLGVCNGFQILCETGLLPGILMRNRDQLFICDNIYLKCTNTRTFMSDRLNNDDVLKIPIAHADGRYFDTSDHIAELWQSGQVVYQYCAQDGTVDAESNVNGSVDNIAGIINKSGNVIGMMPHPERAAEDILGNSDGRRMFESIMDLVS